MNPPRRQHGFLTTRPKSSLLRLRVLHPPQRSARNPAREVALRHCGTVEHRVVGCWPFEYLLPLPEAHQDMQLKRSVGLRPLCRLRQPEPLRGDVHLQGCGHTVCLGLHAGEHCRVYM